MDKLFTKYLPVEGEIKEGDIVKTMGEERTTFKEGMNKRAYQKYKFFLCSRDIQVGDKDIHLPTGETLSKIHEESDKELLVAFPSIGLEAPFKVIGEISPDALSYVKEGQEFNKEQLAFRPVGSTYFQEFKTVINFNPGIEACTKGLFDIGVKGPCGHFH